MLFSDSSYIKATIFKIFTESELESIAFWMLQNIETEISGHAKKVITNVLVEKNINKIKKIVKRTYIPLK